MNKELLRQALYALENLEDAQEVFSDISALREALTQPVDKAIAQPVQPVLSDVEQYRMQMTAISTAALGYWKKGDSIHPDYLTVALHDVAGLYKKYDALYQKYVARGQS